MIKSKSTQLKLTRLLFPLLLLLLACARNSQDSMGNDMEHMTDHDMPTEETAQMDEVVDNQGDGEIGLDLGDKIIENAFLSYETTNFESALEYVNEQVSEQDGLVEYSNRGQSTYQNRSGDYISMTIRIPQEQLHPFIDSLDAFEELYILSQQVGRQDVTQNYRDNETRIEVLEEEEAALRELMQEQGTLEELLQIRRRLTEVISEREIFENQNQAFDEQVAYSTVELSIQQTDRASGQDVSGFWDRLINAIVDSFYSFISITQNLLISFVYFIPFLLIFGILGWIIYLFLKNRRKSEL